MISDNRNTTARVALVRTKNRKEGVLKALNLFGINPVKGKKVMLKPNFNTADPFPASTHNDTLSTFITSLKGMGATSITIAERSGPANTRDVLGQKGIFRLAEELGFDIINLEEMKPEGWVHLTSQGGNWRNGFLFARPYLEAESIVTTCCLKTHMFGGHFTISLKNSVGMVSRNNMGELHSSPYQRQLIAEINTAYNPDLILVDGLTAFVDGGPMEGTVREAGVILVGNDRVAIDATGVAILRMLGTTREVSRGPVFGLDQIKRAAELGLGVKSPEQIKYVTGDAESETFARDVMNMMLEGAKK